MKILISLFTLLLTTILIFSCTIDLCNEDQDPVFVECLDNYKEDLFFVGKEHEMNSFNFIAINTSLRVTETGLLTYTFRQDSTFEIYVKKECAKPSNSGICDSLNIGSDILEILLQGNYYCSKSLDVLEYNPFCDRVTYNVLRGNCFFEVTEAKPIDGVIAQSLNYSYFVGCDRFSNVETNPIRILEIKLSIRLEPKGWIEVEINEEL